MAEHLWSPAGSRHTVQLSCQSEINVAQNQIIFSQQYKNRLLPQNYKMASIETRPSDEEVET